MLVGACAVDGNELSRRQGRLDDFITRAQSSRLGWLTVHSSLSLSLCFSSESQSFVPFLGSTPQPSVRGSGEREGKRIVGLIKSSIERARGEKIDLHNGCVLRVSTCVWRR